jgi:hypothetical protein
MAARHQFYGDQALLHSSAEKNKKYRLGALSFDAAPAR